MKSTWIKQEGHQSVLLFFNGWGMDEKIARYLSNNSSDDCPYDILHCNDYRDTILPEEVHNQLKNYEQRIVIAWSFGVWVANQVGLSNVTKAIALNGTLSPINTFKGIAPPIFQATLDNYDEHNRERFMRRICGGNRGYKAFEPMAPERTVLDQKRELIALQKQVLSGYRNDRSWCYQHVIIGGKDLIFTDTAQQRAWPDTRQTLINDMPHLPFYEFNSWQEILSCLD